MHKESLPSHLDIQKQIPVLLKKSSLRKMTLKSLDTEKLCFSPEATVHTLVLYVSSQLKQHHKSNSLYVISEARRVISPRTTFRELYQTNKGSDGLLRLEVLTYSAF